MRRNAAASVLASGEAPNGKRSFDRDYWLAHCEGFRVESPAGRLGLVEEVVSQTATGRRFWSSGRARPARSARADERRRLHRPARATPVPALGRELTMATKDEARLDDELLEQTRHREFRCAGCGHGAIAAAAPVRCPMCGATSWQENEKFEGRKR